MAPECVFLHPTLVSLNRDNSFEKNGGDDGTRTRDLCRDRVPRLGNSSTYGEHQGTQSIENTQKGTLIVPGLFPRG